MYSPPPTYMKHNVLTIFRCTVQLCGSISIVVKQMGVEPSQLETEPYTSNGELLFNIIEFHFNHF